MPRVQSHIQSTRRYPIYQNIHNQSTAYMRMRAGPRAAHIQCMRPPPPNIHKLSFISPLLFCSLFSDLRASALHSLTPAASTLYVQGRRRYTTYSCISCFLRPPPPPSKQLMRNATAPETCSGLAPAHVPPRSREHADGAPRSREKLEPKIAPLPPRKSS